jgi:DNA-binding MarR family transcriptional regulator
MSTKETNDYNGKNGVNKVTSLAHFRQRQAMLNLVETLNTPSERRVLLCLRNNCRPLNLGDISHKCRLQEQDARSVLAILVRKGLVRRVDGNFFTSP